MSTAKGHETRALWLTGMLHAFTHAYQVALLPLYLLIKRDFHLAGEGEATLLLTVMLTAAYLPSYPIGILADRMSRKALLALGLVVNGLGFIGMALAPNYAWVVAFTALAGFGGSFYHPAATAMIARLFPRNTGKALGLVGIGAGAGFFFAPLYAGWRASSLEAVLGAAAWRRPVLEMGLLGLLGAGLFAWLADPERPATEHERKPVAAGKIFPSPVLWFLFLAYCFAFSLRDFAGASMGTLSSLFLQKARGFDPKWTGLALSVMFLMAMISNPLFGSLSDGGRKRWTALALSLAAVAVLLFPHVPGAGTVPALAAYGFFFMGAYPMTEAALMESVPDAVRGRVFGIFVMVGGVLGNLAHWFSGARVRSFGDSAYSVPTYYPTFNMMAALLLLSLAGLAALYGLRKKEHEYMARGVVHPSPAANLGVTSTTTCE